MSYSKEKAGILSTASAVIVFAMEAFANGEYIAGGVLALAGVALFGLYEFFQVKEIPFTEDEIRDGADEVADEIDERTGSNE